MIEPRFRALLAEEGETIAGALRAMERFAGETEAVIHVLVEWGMLTPPDGEEGFEVVMTARLVSDDGFKDLICGVRFAPNPELGDGSDFYEPGEDFAAYALGKLGDALALAGPQLGLTLDYY